MAASDLREVDEFLVLEKLSRRAEECRPKSAHGQAAVRIAVLAGQLPGLRSLLVSMFLESVFPTTVHKVVDEEYVKR